ncbi:hypothetical protein [Burkholderia cepacia]|uniref:hypothetical protein n=1 Tax=Burkholderia cepacia TaxID=292 RepID=UPI002FE1D421
MSKKIDMQSPFPPDGVLPLDSSGRWTRPWLEFIMKQYERTGGMPGVDTSALKAKVDDLEMLLNAHASTAAIAVLLQRVATLEKAIMSMPLPTHQRAPQTLPDPVATPARVATILPEPVIIPPRVSDDIRKLIEARK